MYHNKPRLFCLHVHMGRYVLQVDLRYDFSACPNPQIMYSFNEYQRLLLLTLYRITEAWVEITVSGGSALATTNKGSSKPRIYLGFQTHSQKPHEEHLVEWKFIWSLVFVARVLYYSF